MTSPTSTQTGFTSSDSSTVLPFHATIVGTPRIGPRRELKKALENYWKDPSTGRALSSTALQLVNDYQDHAAQAGLDSIPTHGRSYYDSMLDTAALLSVLPDRVHDIADHDNDGLPAAIDRIFATARGTDTLPAAGMTKWFDTNYHYLVPELRADTEFRLDDSAFLQDLKDQSSRNPIRPVLIGPLTFLALSRTTDGSPALDHLEAVFSAYERLLPRIAALGIEWVQFDEPYLVTDIAEDPTQKEDLLRRTRAGYEQLAASTEISLLLQTYFGDGNQALETLSGSGIRAFGVDLVSTSAISSTADKETILPAWTGEEILCAGIVDGRNVWRTDIQQALTVLQGLSSRGSVVVSTSCSLLHVPYSLAQESSLDQDPELRSWLAFGAEKIHEVAVLSRLLNGIATTEDEAFAEEAASAIASRAQSQRTHNEQLRAELSTLKAEDRQRSSFEQRLQAQQEQIALPPLPTTTIGSFPQTAEIRRARAQYRSGALSEEAYTEAMKAEIAEVIKRQEELGLDVLVHGEPERNDMVQYFSEQLTGYHSTELAWVQSYGSRCVRPPILYGDVSRPHPMTVSWFREAQSLTAKPVKGMLTGPVTMLAWSFVRDDQPLGETADQVGWALRQEVADLSAAGAQIIQVDEPAIRELLPLKKEDQPAYLEWAVGAFRLATAGAEDATQIHTHMCYSEFNELIDTVSDLDADVTSIEAARQGMQVLSALSDSGFKLGVGPGVWDIHSPRVPSSEEVESLLSSALESVPAQQLWVNPDCGLKTRGWEETLASLEVLVSAAQKAREGLQTA